VTAVAVFDRLLTRSPFARVVGAALDEARERGDRRMGTEHLLLGLLGDPGSEAALALGVDLRSARAALDELELDALRTIGIDPGRIRGLAELPRRHPPLTVAALTTGARTVVRLAVDSTTARTRGTAPRHLLLALLDRARPDPVAELVDHLGVDRDAVRVRLAA
jgi:ATP-dependent Clp protease ATP-binding subunit ClpA